MAQISQNDEAKNSGGKVRTKKQSTRIDMTPMVDLAFLLLTFFIMTTTFNKPGVMELTMPEPASDPKFVPMLPASNALNLVLGEDNKVYWWKGLDRIAVVTNYSKEGVQKILLQQSKANPRLMVLIKPMDKARYENMVDILDEVEIANIARYAIVDFTDDDQARIP